MAGRGKGRGRGKAAFSFNVEQLGLSPGEAMPDPVLQPPPLYPLMENRPLPLQTGPEREYLLALKQDFVNFFRDSPAFLQPDVIKTDIERYSDCYQSVSKTKTNLDYDWKRFPQELRPQTTATNSRKRKQIKVSMKNAKLSRKSLDITSRLAELEKREEQGSDAEAEEEGQEAGEEKDGEEVEIEEDVDEEMDDGTDYINNYFDNGEGYDDEDDNMEDGPVY